MEGLNRVRQLPRSTRIPKTVLTKHDVGNKLTNTGINMSLINLNAITHKKKAEIKRNRVPKQRVPIPKPVAQALHSQMCLFSIDVPQETVQPSSTTSDPAYSGSLIAGARMNTIFSSHNWGNRK